MKFDLQLFKNFKLQKNFFIAGCDEVGRGSLAGPVVASCVCIHFIDYHEEEFKRILKGLALLGVNDSKKLSSQKRQKIKSNFTFGQEPLSVNQIYTQEYSNNASLKICIKEIPSQTIDKINILNAALLAMNQASEASCGLETKGLLLIDGNKKFQSKNVKMDKLTVIGGDAKSLLIGLASIFAKEYRDTLMNNFCKIYPGYGLDQNAGYGTVKHLDAIVKLGVSEIHRRTFRGVKEYCNEERG